MKPKADAQHVIFHSYDTYTTNVPLADFAADDVLLAWSWNGEPISREHGGPLRVVIPKLYFWKSAKWIKRVEFSVLDKPGFWEAARLPQLRRSLARAALRRGDLTMASAHDFTFTGHRQQADRHEGIMPASRCWW